MPDKSNDSLTAELLEVQRTLGWMDVVLGNITDAVYVIDNDARLLFANQFFSDLVDQPRVFLLGQKLSDAFQPSLKKDPQKEFLVDLGAGEDIKASGANVYEWVKDGKPYIFKISYRLIPTTDQTVYIAKDITAEYEISLMKSNFINIASHQLRTPMTAIMTYAHMLHDGMAGDLDEPQKKFAKTIITSSERMISMINDILLITRIQNGETNLLVKDSHLADVISSVEAEIKPRLEQKKLRLAIACNPEVGVITCNKFITSEIVSNLLINAVQYTSRGGSISINVNVQSNQVEISVTDSGIGIPEEDLSIIFDQFTRAKNAMEVFNEGTGLGLYLVKILLTHIKGNIFCKSKLNKGSTFMVSFPI